MKRISVADKAAELFVGLQSAQRIEDKWQELEQWSSESREHDAAFARIEHTWALADRLKDKVNPDLFLIEVSTERQGVLRNVMDRWPVWGKLGWFGAAALVAGALWVFHKVPHPLSPAKHASWERITTGIGEHRKLVLRDGSTVDLNTQTTVRVKFDSVERVVLLERGEALFKVAHDTKRPFLVRTGLNRVEAVGTEFSILEKNEMEMTVIVTEGEIKIFASGDTFQRVGARQAANTSEQGIKVIELKPGEAERRTSWIQGDLRFDGETLGEVVQQFNRYNEEKILIKDPSIENSRVAGTYSARDPEGFAEMMEELLKVRHFITSDNGRPTIALTGKGIREKGS